MSDKIERLRAFIKQLQDALGWVIEIERKSYDGKNYIVNLRFDLTFRGKSWPDILRNAAYQAVVCEMVKNKLAELWQSELEKFPNGGLPKSGKKKGGG